MKATDNQQSQEADQFIGMSFNGKKTGFEPANRGSNPCIPANFYNDNIEYFDDL